MNRPRTLPAFVTALALALVSIGASVPARAADPVVWGVAPSTQEGPDGRSAFDLKLDPGATLIDFVAVDNFAEAPLTVRIYAGDAHTTAHGGFDLPPAGTPPVDVGSWIFFNEESVTIPARKRVIVPFTVAVPGNATPGDHVGGIVASVAETGADGVTVDRRVGARVHLRVSGELRPELAPEHLTVAHATNWNPTGPGKVRLDVTVANPGNVRLTGTLTAVLGGPFGIGERRVALGALPQILPGDEFSLSTEIGEVWPLTRVAIDLTVKPAAMDGETLRPPPVEAVASASLVAMPWSQLIVLAVLIALLWTLWRLRRRAKRRVEQRIERAVAEAVADRAPEHSDPEEKA